VRYSFVGAIKQPRQVLDGGYLSWFDPATQHAFQLFVTGTKKSFKDLGPVPGGFGTLRAFTDDAAVSHRVKALGGAGPQGLLLTAAYGAGRTKARQTIGYELKGQATALQKQIDMLSKG